MITLVNKQVGMTPSMMMSSLFRKSPSLIKRKYSYYGKLDPMADGPMVVLWDEECKNLYYRELEKTYEVEIALGIKTDTGDLMGLVTVIQSLDPASLISGSDINLDSFLTRDTALVLEQLYPDYSYRKVKGKPLWWWAQRGLIDEVKGLIPKKIVKIEAPQLLSTGTIDLSLLSTLAIKRIALVEGEFRQSQISDCWRSLAAKEREVFKTVKFSVSVSSGTYIRGLADRLGGVVVNLKRTKVSPFSLTDPSVVEL